MRMYGEEEEEEERKLCISRLRALPFGVPAAITSFIISNSSRPMMDEPSISAQANMNLIKSCVPIIHNIETM